MCVIIDANVAADAFRNPTVGHHAPVFAWIEKRGGQLVVGGRLLRELYIVQHCKRYVIRLLQAGLARRMPAEDVDSEEKRIENFCVSDDAHIVALARVSGARTLYSADTDLHKDFRNRKLISKPMGRIYQTSSHAHLLEHTGSCGRKKR